MNDEQVDEMALLDLLRELQELVQARAIAEGNQSWVRHSEIANTRAMCLARMVLEFVKWLDVDQVARIFAAVSADFLGPAWQAEDIPVELARRLRGGKNPKTNAAMPLTGNLGLPA